MAGSFVGGNTWRTDWINNNEVYQLIINDRHDCLPDTTSNTYECPCINGLGNLNKTPIILCANATAQAVYNAASGTPDGNDVVRFVLYDGNPAAPKTGTFINVNASGTFSFDASKCN